ncbi:MAG: EVE domain-containing protein [SAR202 cluster bacterium]|nr:EVE domain-containing protein [SAR202 cluster bacterium]
MGASQASKFFFPLESTKLFAPLAGAMNKDAQAGIPFLLAGRRARRMSWKLDQGACRPVMAGESTPALGGGKTTRSGHGLGKTYWMLVMTGDNFEITRRRGFDLQGVESSQRRKALRLSSDDRILFYLSDSRRFAATATVTSGHFEDHEKIWSHHRSSEDFPHRVKIRADAVLNPDQYLDAYQIGPRLEYVRKWPPESWELAFIGALHIIPQKDFSLLEDEMRRVISTQPQQSQQSQRGPRKRRSRRGRRRFHGEFSRDENGARAETAGAQAGSEPSSGESTDTGRTGGNDQSGHDEDNEA